jgi:hypothetical protein
VTDEDGDGAADCLPGWPVPLNSKPEFGLVGPEKICDTDMPAQCWARRSWRFSIRTSRRRHFRHPSVIIPTTETCNESMIPTGRVYAIYWNGLNNEDGPFLPDWPAKTLPRGRLAAHSAADDRHHFQPGGGLLPANCWWASAVFLVPANDPLANNKVEMETLGSGGEPRRERQRLRSSSSRTTTICVLLPHRRVPQRHRGNFYLESFNVVGWRLGDAALRFPQALRGHQLLRQPGPCRPQQRRQAGDDRRSGGYIIHASDIDLAQPTVGRNSRKTGRFPAPPSATWTATESRSRCK